MKITSCPSQNLFNFLSKRWMLLILKSINEEKETFSEIKKCLGSISARILSERLTDLQNEGYINRNIVQEKPVKIRYTITEKGKSLGNCLVNLDNFVKDQLIN